MAAAEGALDARDADAGISDRAGCARFREALGAPEVLITRAKRDNSSADRRLALPASPRCDQRLSAARQCARRITRALDDPGAPRRQTDVCRSANKGRTRPVTSVDRLKADPFAFYASSILRCASSIRSTLTIPLAGKARRFTRCSRSGWLTINAILTGCAAGRAAARGDEIHPMLRALWAPRLLEAIDWIAELERMNQAEGRKPLRRKSGRGYACRNPFMAARRIDRLLDGGLGIVDYKTGKPPSKKAIEAGFALQLGLLGLIGRAGGFEGVTGEPEVFEYWSLIRDRGSFGKASGRQGHGQRRVPRTAPTAVSRTRFENG